MTSIAQNLHDKTPYIGNEHITAANGQRLSISGAGQLVDNGYSVIFSSNGCVICDRQTGTIIGTGCKHGRMYL